MLYILFVSLLSMWLIALLTSYAMGGLIHVLLAIAVVVFIVDRFQKTHSFAGPGIVGRTIAGAAFGFTGFLLMLLAMAVAMSITGVYL